MGNRWNRRYGCRDYNSFIGRGGVFIGVISGEGLPKRDVKWLKFTEEGRLSDTCHSLWYGSMYSYSDVLYLCSEYYFHYDKVSRFCS